MSSSCKGKRKKHASPYKTEKLAVQLVKYNPFLMIYGSYFPKNVKAFFANNYVYVT